MVVDAYGFVVDTEAFKGYNKKEFCETFKSANRKLSKKGKTIADVWELIKKDIPKVEIKKKMKPIDKKVEKDIIGE